MTGHTLTCRQFYDQVWSKPMTKLARDYGLSDVGLAKVCKKHDIPRPPPGYWAKKRVGKNPRKSPLPRPDEEGSINLREASEAEKAAAEKAASAPKPEVSAGPPVTIAETLRGAHRLVSEANEQLQGAKLDDSGLLVRPKDLGLNIHVINECYGELESDRGSVAKAFAPQVRIDLIKQDLKKCRKKSPLAKYNVALHSAGKPKLDEGKGLGQEFNNLRELRNAMTHYRPEWSDGLDEHSDLETRLKSKFPQSALMPVVGMAWFPNRCFGAGSAAWALDVTERFVHEFCQRVEIAYRLEHTTFKP